MTTRESDLQGMTTLDSTRMLEGNLRDGQWWTEQASDGDDIAPASFAQERFLFLERLHGPSATYNLLSAFDIEGPLDVDALERSVVDVVAQHAVLRSRFVLGPDGAYQAQATEWQPQLERICIGEESDHESAIEEHLQRLAAHRFDVAGGPHLRVQLLRQDDQRHVLATLFHHVVCDGGAIAPLISALQARYAHHAHATAMVPVDAPSYSAYARWERREAAAQSSAEQLAFWKRELADAPARLRLPFERSGATEDAGERAGNVPLRLSKTVQQRLQRVVTAQRVSEFQVVSAALALTIHKLTGVASVVIGTPLSNRQRPHTRSIIGPLLNLAPMHLRVPAGGTVGDLLAEARRSALAAVEHGHLPFERLVQHLRPAREFERSPLFRVLCALESTPRDLLRLPKLSVRQRQLADNTNRFDLALILQREAGVLGGMLKFDLALFDEADVRAFAGHFQNALEALLDHPDRRLSDIGLLGVVESGRVLRQWNDTRRDDVSDPCLHDAVARRAREHPQRLAVCFEGQSLTYAELNARANRLAHHLISLGVGCDDWVAISLDRGLDMVVSALAVLKAGAAYLPVDPEYPLDRRRWMLEDAGATLLIAAAQADAGEARWVDPARALDADLPADDPGPRARADSACYVVYTSGSTGRPKGTITDHRAIVNNLDWMDREWPLDASDAVLLKSSFSFDVSVKEIFWPLRAGARLEVARPGGQRDPEYLARTIQSRSITVVHMVPTMLEYFLARLGEEDACQLRIVMCGGEELKPALRRRFHARFDAILLHLYGPTEASIAVTGLALSREDEVEQKVMLGRPMANCQLYVLGSDLQPLPAMAVGELYIGGLPLARGYLNRPQLTGEKFIPDPFGAAAGGRLYRTGDLARWKADGQLEYVGRVDRQVKLRGLRVEPGEVEAAIRRQPGVRGAAVVCGDGAGAGALVAYVVTEPQALETVQVGVRRELPAFMVPGRYVVLSTLPTGPNGKVDLGGLPAPNTVPSNVEPVACESGPRGELERRLAALWCELLAIEHVGRDQNFFDAGGHSMLILQLQARLRADFSRDVSVADLFRFPTVATLASRLSTAEQRESAQAATEAPPAASLPRACPVAVVGMAGRFPGASDLAAYWHQSLHGELGITFFDDDMLRQAGVPEAHLADPHYVRARGVVEGSEQFDAAAFRMGPREAAILDPQIRLLLELGRDALEDGACDPQRWQRETGGRIGVFVSSSRSTYYLHHLHGNPHVAASYDGLQIATATDRSFAATQLAYRLDLHGPALSIDTACSSSLVAVHEACKSLERHEADLILAGGASVDAPMHVGYQCHEGSVLSPDGHCRPFDADAAGTVKGNGGGVVLLKRLQDALDHNDRIYAVIRGSATNNDGAAKVGFTAPGADGQVRVMREAQARAGLSARDIDYLEAHGTGTKLGDPIEFDALTKVFGEHEVRIGAVKANIGHLDAASGIAGFIKAALTAHHGVMPPQANYRHPNPQLAMNARGPQINTQPIASPPEHQLRAGVSSFGIGGTNAHVILESAPPPPSDLTQVQGAPKRSCLVALSATSAQALRGQAQRLAEHLDALSDVPPLPALARTLNLGRPERSHRAALLVGAQGDLMDALRTLACGAGPSPAATHGDVHGGLRVRLAPKAAQWRGSGAALLAQEPTCRADLLALTGAERSASVLAWWQGQGVGASLLPAFEDEAAAAVQAVLIASLRRLGVRVDEVCGTRAPSVAAMLDSLGGPALAVVDEASSSRVPELLFAPGTGSAGRPAAVIHRDDAHYRHLMRDGTSPGQLDIDDLLAAVAWGWCLGLPVNWRADDRIARARPVSLPPTPFERKRHWIAAPTTATPSGQLPSNPTASSATPTGKREDVEGAVRAVWDELVGTEGAQAQDNFFMLGGTSLLATQMLRDLEASLGVRVPLETFYAEPTLLALVDLVETGLTQGHGELGAADEETTRDPLAGPRETIDL